MLSSERLRPFFFPKSVVIVGDSETPGRPGNIVLSNLKNADFQGKIFPLHPEGQSILGLPSLRKLQDIPQEYRPVDLAILVPPSSLEPEAIDDLAGIPSRAVLVMGGRREKSRPGAFPEKEIKAKAEKHGLLMLGPESLGLVNTRGRLHALPVFSNPKAGGIGFFSESGALGLALLDWAGKEGMGFSAFVSLGNKAMLDESDILAYLADDPETRVIAGCLGSITRGRRFLHAALPASRRKPIILFRSGHTASGSRAASSNSGALFDPDLAYEAIFKQSGVLRAEKLEDVFLLARSFASQPLPQGPGVGIITNCGGAGIVAADACENAGLNLSALSAETFARLKDFLPPFASFFNPVNMTEAADEEAIRRTLEAVLADRSVQAAIIVLMPTAVFPSERLALSLLSALSPRKDKPVLCCFMGGQNVDNAHRLLEKAGFPCCRFPEEAAASLAAMYKYSRWRLAPLPVEICYRRDLSRARKVIDEARGFHMIRLAEFQAQELFQAYEMPLLKTRLARTSEEAVQISRQFKQAVALKIASPQIYPKTDVDGVLLDLKNPADIRNAFMDITARAKRLRPEAHIAGCLVQVMAPREAREAVVRFRRTERFGTLVMFSLGGIHLEVFKDITCRLVPLSLDDAGGMIREIHAFPLLSGLRGAKSANLNALEDILLIMSQMAQDFPEIEEAECDPVLVSEQGALVADMRVILSKQELQP